MRRPFLLLLALTPLPVRPFLPAAPPAPDVLEPVEEGAFDSPAQPMIASPARGASQENLIATNLSWTSRVDQR